jgi:acetolactate synthase-1/2/3 large subunit
VIPGPLADGFASRGVRRLFTARAAGDAGGALEVIEAPSPALAVILAGVGGDVADAPAAVLLTPEDVVAARDALAWARLDRVPLIVLVAAPGAEPGRGAHPSTGSRWRAGFKALVSRSAADDVAGLTVALALQSPRGPVRVALGPGLPGEDAVPARPGPGEEGGAPIDVAALDAAATMIAAAARPVVVAGLETRRADGPAWLRPFAESLPAPVLTTLRAKGALADPHPLALGLLAGPVAPRLLARADLVIALGLDPVEPNLRAWSPGVPILELGPASAAGLAGPGSARVSGAVPAILAELAWRLRGRTQADWDVAELDRIKRAEWLAATTSATGQVARMAREMTVSGTVAAVEGGAEAAAVARAWQAVAPGDFLAPAALVPPGFAPAAALAAALVRPDARALAFTGPGGVAAARPALALAAARALPVTVVALGAASAPALAAFPRALADALARPGPSVVSVGPV